MTTDNTVPIPIVLTIKFILQMGSNFLGGMHFLQGIFGDDQDLCLHIWADVFVLDYWL